MRVFYIESEEQKARKRRKQFWPNGFGFVK